MVSEDILSSYVGSEITLFLHGKKRTAGKLEKVEGGRAYLDTTKGEHREMPLSEIKSVERKPEGHGDFEKKVNYLILEMIRKGEAKDEKEAMEILKKKFL
jgi:hypothetical protein